MVPHKGGHFVIELKISKNAVADDRSKAREALDQILTKGYAKGLENPVLLGLAVNEPKREVTTWIKRIGLRGPDVWTLPDPPEPASRPPEPPAASPEEPAGQAPPAPSPKRSGPRM